MLLLSLPILHNVRVSNAKSTVCEECDFHKIAHAMRGDIINDGTNVKSCTMLWKAIRFFIQHFPISENNFRYR